MASSSAAGRANRTARGSLKSRILAPLALSFTLLGCSTVSDLVGGGGGPEPGQAGFVSGFLGGVVADEPRAALAGREVLSAGGNAADAAVAMGLTLSVTLPSRASLGSGGACLAFAAGRKSINGGVPEAILFTSPPAAAPGANVDRPASPPMLARGMFLLHARYGSQKFEALLVNAEQLARFGVPVSRALANDLALVSGPLFADPLSRAVFSRAGVPLAEGQTLMQPELAGTLTQLRTAGVGDLYQGALARRIEQAAPLAGAALPVSVLREALPKLAAPLVVPYRSDKIAFLPPPADGGLAAEAAFNALVQGLSSDQAAARGLAVAARWRGGNVTPEAALADPAPSGSLPPLPASTSFAALDRSGNAVVCDVSMNNLFGTGRILQGTGIVAAAAPSPAQAPLLSAALAWNDNLHAFRAAVGGSGQAGAPIAVAAGLFNTLRTSQPMPAPVPDPGRASVIACGRYLPTENASCGWAVDPRELGLALGGS